MIDYIYMKSNSIKLLVALSFLIFLSSMSFAQESYRVQGLLRDSLSRVVSGATVQLVSEKDTLGTSSSTAGTFSFDNVKAKEFSIQINSIGFQAFSQTFTNGKNEKTYSLPPVTLIPIDNLIEEVVVEGRLTIQIKGDTVEYDTKNLKLRDDAIVEDALKRLEGVEVDKDGNVKSEGEDIKRVRINGKDFFGGDVKTATKNLPADIIRKIQVVDDYGDIASMTGDKSGESEKVLNIVIDPDKNNGFTSTIRAGYGTDDRYQA
ncbi:MAG TPA: carboxypeptidase-like regulatory domain-containing protein, partial [Candidatus Sphingobacterium stercoripullorum]|nr:carboxypeptidase-like regulatory domain-containing protein [Candidatus Sphingobacterium stercoripullorum]